MDNAKCIECTIPDGMKLSVLVSLADQLTTALCPAPPAPVLTLLDNGLSFTKPAGVASTNLYHAVPVVPPVSPIQYTFVFVENTLATQVLVSPIVPNQFYAVTSIGDGVTYCGESPKSNIIQYNPA